MVIGSIRLIYFVVYPVVSGECEFIVLCSFSSTGINELLVEDNSCQPVPYLQGSYVRNLNAQILARPDLVGVACTCIFYFISAIILGSNASCQHCNLKVIDLDLRDDSIYVVHGEWPDPRDVRLGHI